MSKEQKTVEETAVAEESNSDEAVAEMESRAENGEELSPEELTLMLVDARGKADEHWDQLMRTKAEIDNLRKRQERELANAHKFALERFVTELLPVIDSLELGVNAAQETAADAGKLHEGMELTLKLFSGAMEKFNVEQLNPEGEAFNPEFHQAMAMQPRDDVPPNIVVTVIQKGYMLNGRLVRPAMVMVSQGAAGKVNEQA
jgi:molecular chaperone GrpE